MKVHDLSVRISAFGTLGLGLLGFRFSGLWIIGLPSVVR